MRHLWIRCFWLPIVNFPFHSSVMIRMLIMWFFIPFNQQLHLAFAWKSLCSMSIKNSDWSREKSPAFQSWLKYVCHCVSIPKYFNSYLASMYVFLSMLISLFIEYYYYRYFSACVGTCMLWFLRSKVLILNLCFPELYVCSVCLPKP